jgi:superfamily I DNA/RNA helicase
MAYKVVHTKGFNGCLRGLNRDHKKAVQAARSAMSEACMSGEIRSVPRTKHGETRLPDIEKYDLSDGYRLVVQLIDGADGTRAFLFCGSHDDTERWLDSHQRYRWVKSRTDGTLDFVQVTERKEERHIPADRMDLESPEELLDLPLLRVLAPEEWKHLELSEQARAFAESVLSSDYERDADGILKRLDELAGWEKASLIFDLFVHAHAREWPELHRRVSVAARESVVTEPQEVAPAMSAVENSESFITFDDPADLGEFFTHNSMADWMLFLHPDQKRVVDRTFRGPARLRGVSGSGKTSVLVHRARFLAKLYKQPILLVTLAESMRKLLDRLADDLCGVERSLILTQTMAALARNVVQEWHPQSSGWYSQITTEEQDKLFLEAVSHVVRHPDFQRTPMHSMAPAALLQFLRDEIQYVRGRLREAEFEQYLDAQAFRRYGRGIPLNETARRVVLETIRYYHAQLAIRGLLDYEGIVAAALDALEDPKREGNKARCVLCDEVQDLSQLEMALVAKLPTPSGESIANAENGLFLAGDGAQTIYKRGFVLRRLGIDVNNRSFCLRKNYRNTYEILKAAFGLVERFEFADVDEENVIHPTAPEFAKRHGSRPLIVRCSSPVEEATVIAAEIHSRLAMGDIPGQICIVGPSRRSRAEVEHALSNAGIEVTSLREDADYESSRVKISTIESAKGHEFGTVFVMGLVEGVLPLGGLEDAEIPREAARLYVAMTRARDTLTLTYSEGPGYPPSRFLLAIQPDCDEARLTDSGLIRIRPS